MRHFSDDGDDDSNSHAAANSQCVLAHNVYNDDCSG